MVLAASRLRDDVILLEQFEREVHPAEEVIASSPCTAAAKRGRVSDQGAWTATSTQYLPQFSMFHCTGVSNIPVKSNLNVSAILRYPVSSMSKAAP